MRSQRRVRDYNDRLIDNIDEFLEYNGVRVGDCASYHHNLYEGHIKRIYRAGWGGIRCEIQHENGVVDFCIDNVVSSKQETHNAIQT